MKLGTGAVTKRPTLKTVAEKTGLAVTTVSKALNGAPEIAAKTRLLVENAAREIGYVPDRAAQRLRTGKTNVISLVLSPHDEILGFSNSLTLGLSRALRATNYNLLVTPSFEESTEIKTIEKIVRNKMADGIIFSRTEPFDERVRLLIENNFPFVCHGRTELSSTHSFVDFDNEEFARLAVSQLANKNRKRLFAVMPDRKFTFYGHLKYGFTSAAADIGVSYEVPDDVNLDSAPEEIYACIARRIEKGTCPDGFVCAGEVAAMTIMACLSDHDLLVGRDVDIVAKQTSRVFDHIRPRVDTIIENIAEAGAMMGKMLLDDISNPNAPREGFVQRPESELLL
ncbi:LacI family transcriptional regulator [Ahrensia kielensis]|uniref:LacI family transcriptional regulator n=1 Tax=Ahrensia kielensis TaxID=76980 RepID=UPI00036E4BC7|nr:LacI family transcriptional regulator [Ahrensia kielensis]